MRDKMIESASMRGNVFRNLKYGDNTLVIQEQKGSIEKMIL